MKLGRQRRWGTCTWGAILLLTGLLGWPAASPGAHDARASASSHAPMGQKARDSSLPAAAPHASRMQQGFSTGAAHVADATGGDDAVYEGDVTVPDGSVFRPGQQFTKIWRIRNTGIRAWLPSYRWHFEAGSQLSTVTSVAVPLTAPGAAADIGVPMTAPTSTGVFTSFWQMANASGQLFGHQAWVRIQVRANGPTTSVPTPLTHGSPLPTPTPTATSSPVAPQPPVSNETPQPTVVIPGGSGQLVASPWIGALTYRTFFAAGSTAFGMHEALALYYPGNKTTHIRLTLFRPDGAQRMLLFTLQSNELRVLRLNRIAPGTNLAATIEADRRVVVQRLFTSAHSLLGDPGAARTARSWLFPAIPTGAPASQLLQFFNPHDVSSTVSVRIALPSGGCCASITTITIPPQQQFTYSLGSASTLRGPMIITASGVVAVERLASTTDWGTVATIPGTPTSATHWYLPDASVANGGTSIALFNAGARPIQATVRLALNEGRGAWQQRTVLPFSEVQVALTSMTAAQVVGVEISASGPIIAAASRTLGGSQPEVTLAGALLAPVWSMVGGFAGSSEKEAVALLNPTNQTCQVTLAVHNSAGQGTSWSVNLPAHSRYGRDLTGLWSAEGGALTIQASVPIAVGHTMVDRLGASSAPGAILTTP